jgi:predicted Rossmann-fold nucleotide-binding protein
MRELALLRIVHSVGYRTELKTRAVLVCVAMAKVPINDPKHWRDRAEEARTVAAEMTDPEAKRKTLRIAEDYEELARRAEKRLRATQNSKEG